MSSILPLRSEPQTGGQEPRVVGLEGDDADAVFNALSSGTARRIIACTHRDPKTQSEIAEAIDTSVQNVRYHLDKLEAAGLIDVVDTWYSSRGNEMKVYAPADGALIVSGDEGKASRLKAAITRLVGGIGVVAIASLVVQALLGTLAGSRIGQESGDSGGSPMSDRAEDSGPANATHTGGEDAAETEARTTPVEDGGVTGADESTLTRTTVEDAPTADTVERGVEYAHWTNESVAGVNVTGPHSPSSPGPAPAPTSDPTTTGTTVDALMTTASAADGTGAAVGLPPGLAFFLGAVSALVVVVALWYWSGY